MSDIDTDATDLLARKARALTLWRALLVRPVADDDAFLLISVFTQEEIRHRISEGIKRDSMSVPLHVDVPLLSSTYRARIYRESCEWLGVTP